MYFFLFACGSDAPTEESFWTTQTPDGEFELELSCADVGNSVGVHEYKLVVLDDSGQHVKGLDIEIELWMPDHGHGSDRPTQIEAKETHYLVRAVSYTMPGFWEVTRIGLLSETRTTPLRLMFGDSNRIDTLVVGWADMAFSQACCTATGSQDSRWLVGANRLFWLCKQVPKVRWVVQIGRVSTLS